VVYIEEVSSSGRAGRLDTVTFFIHGGGTVRDGGCLSAAALVEQQ